MKRREVLTLIGGAAVTWPLTARGQQPNVGVAGFVSSGSADGFAHLLVALRQGLRDKGYVESQNLTVEYRWADGHYDRLPALAADLIRYRVALIISTGGIVAAQAVKAATTEIPVVFASGDDPIRFGIVPSLSRPGGNVTGVTILSSALVPKRLEIVRELLPGSHRLGLFVNAQNPNADANVKDAEVALANGDHIRLALDRDGLAITRLDYPSRLAELLCQVDPNVASRICAGLFRRETTLKPTPLRILVAVIVQLGSAEEVRNAFRAAAQAL